jgi:hypothetical protein
MVRSAHFAPVKNAGKALALATMSSVFAAGE